MLVNTNEVAKRLKITNRAVQNKCKQYGLVKIANQYQITNEIAEQWYKEAETNKEQKQNRTEHLRRTSHRTDINTSLLFWGCVFILIAVLLKFYFNLDSQIKETKKELRQERIEHKTDVKELQNDVKELQKKVDSQKDTISKKEIELQNLKKDNLRFFRRW